MEPIISTLELRSSYPTPETTIKLEEIVVKQGEQIKMLTESIDKLIARFDANDESAVVSEIDPLCLYNDSLAISLIELAKEHTISSKIDSALYSAGIQYVSDFEYVSIADLRQIKGLTDSDILDLMEVLEERFGVILHCGRRISPEFDVKDTVKVLPSTLRGLKKGQMLKIVSIENTLVLPKYVCSVSDGSERYYTLSPSVICDTK